MEIVAKTIKEVIQYAGLDKERFAEEIQSHIEDGQTVEAGGNVKYKFWYLQYPTVLKLYVVIKEYSRQYDSCLLQFLERCLPQSGRSLELDGRHKMYCNIDEVFECFWCLFDENDMIGTVALKRLNDEHCELKSLYLLEQYHEKGLGYQLLKTATLKAQQKGYKKMYLDTLSSSTKAISLYEKMGFVRIGRYNTNYMADVFMVLKLDH